MAKTKWLIDATHSEIGFRVKHLMITNVYGSFSEYEVEVLTEKEDFNMAQIHATIKAGSVSTNNTQRDQHLRNSDFFDIQQYPEINFASERFEQIDDDQFILRGDLTIKGVTNSVSLNVEYSGTTIDPWGGRRAGFVITGKVNRNEFGLSFNTVLDSGGLALGEDVRVHCEIQVVKQEENLTEITESKKLNSYIWQQ